MSRCFKSGFVTIIGRPNVGKSTLMNQLIGQKIAITSSKAQTTRNRIQTVYTSEEGQIVFLDTPGINKAKNKLGDYMLMAAERTLNEVDLILWLVEPTTFIGGGEQYIIEKLQNVKTPIFLVINKTDVATEEEILKAIVAYKDQCNFAEIIPVSALEGNNTDDLVHSIFKYLPEVCISGHSGHRIEHHQIPCFQNPVELQPLRAKDGCASVGFLHDMGSRVLGLDVADLTVNALLCRRDAAIAIDVHASPFWLKDNERHF